MSQSYAPSVSGSLPQSTERTIARKLTRLPLLVWRKKARELARSRKGKLYSLQHSQRNIEYQTQTAGLSLGLPAGSRRWWVPPEGGLAIGNVNVMKDTCAPLSELLTMTVEVNAAGVWCLYARLKPTHHEAAAISLACSIAKRRLPDQRLFQSWQRRATGQLDEPLGDVDSRVIQAALLENVGSPTAPAIDQHLLGLVAEGIWQGVVTDADVGLGIPVRVESHDWSVTDPGGDGLTVYGSTGHYCYRLWESKYHGNSKALLDTVNLASRQVSTRALSYLARFSLVAQYLTDDQQLAAFYGRLAELWADKDLAAGVGIVIGSDSSHEDSSDHCFDKMTEHFELTADQHQGHLNLVDDFRIFAESVRRFLWTGCGLWTEP